MPKRFLGHGWTIEYRSELPGGRHYELMEADAHRGLFDTFEAAERAADKIMHYGYLVESLVDHLSR